MSAATTNGAATAGQILKDRLAIDAAVGRRLAMRPWPVPAVLRAASRPGGQAPNSPAAASHSRTACRSSGGPDGRDRPRRPVLPAGLAKKHAAAGHRSTGPNRSAAAGPGPTRAAARADRHRPAGAAASGRRTQWPAEHEQRRPAATPMAAWDRLMPTLPSIGVAAGSTMRIGRPRFESFCFADRFPGPGRPWPTGRAR